MTILRAQRHQTPMFPPPVILSPFLEKAMVQTQIFKIGGGKSTLVVGQSGIRLTFPAFACRNLAGQPRDGSIRLEIKELCSKGELIAAGMPNATENHMLDSAVVFSLQLLDDDENPLFLELPVEVDIPVNASRHNPLSYRLYGAGQSSLKSFTASSAIPDWKKADSGKLSLRRIHGRTYLHGLIVSPGWWSCSAPVAAKGKQHMISAKCMYPSFHNTEVQQMAFIALQRTNTVMRMYEGNHHFSSFNVPLKLPASIFALGHAGDKYFFCHTPLKPGQVFYYLYMEEIDASFLTTYLNQL